MNNEQIDIDNIKALTMPEDFKNELLKQHLKNLQELRCKLDAVIEKSCSQCTRPRAHLLLKERKLVF